MADKVEKTFEKGHAKNTEKLRKDFNTSGKADEIKKQQEFDRRFKEPSAREAATLAESDEKFLLEEEEKRYLGEIKKYTDYFDADKLNTAEFNRGLIEKITAENAKHMRENENITGLTEAVKREAELSQHQVDIGPIGKDHQLEYQPAPQQRTATGQSWDKAASDEGLRALQQGQQVQQDQSVGDQRDGQTQQQEEEAKREIYVMKDLQQRNDGSWMSEVGSTFALAASKFSRNSTDISKGELTVIDAPEQSTNTFNQRAERPANATFDEDRALESEPSTTPDLQASTVEPAISKDDGGRSL